MAPKVSTTIRRQVKCRIAECIEIAERQFPGFSFPMPRIDYGLTGTTAGTATSSTYSINLNAQLLIDNREVFINRTVVHEFAHLVDAIVYPHTRETKIKWTPRGYRRTRRDLHGRTWKAIMILFGAEPSRCHTYDVSKISARNGRSPYVWECGCGGAQIALGAKRHKKMLALAHKKLGVYATNHDPRICGHYTYVRRDPGAPKVRYIKEDK